MIVQSHEQLNESYSTFYMGVILQCTNMLSKCKSIEELTSIYTYLQSQLDIPCYLRINSRSFHINQRFGRFSSTTELSELLKMNIKATKIFSNSHHLICNYSNYLSIFEVNDTEKISVLQDVIALWTDIVENWIKQFEIEQKESSKLKNDINDVLNKVVNVTQGICKKQIEIPRELISLIAANLSSIGMDSDHEEYVLDVIDQAIKSYNQCFDSQLESNIQVTHLLNGIYKEIDSKSNEFSDGITNNIVLF